MLFRSNLRCHQLRGPEMRRDLLLIDDPELQEGRAAFQGPEVDGTVGFIDTNFKMGQWVKAVITESAGADLIAKVL